MKKSFNAYSDVYAADNAFGAYSSTASAYPLQLWGAWGDDDLRQSGKTSYDRPVFSGQGEAGKTLYVYDNGVQIASTVVSAENNWFFQIPLPQGHHNLTFGYAPQQPGISLSFDVGNVDVGTLAPPEVAVIFIDNQIGSLGPGTTITDATPRFVGQGQEGQVVYIYDNNVAIASATVGYSNNWFIDVPALSAGEHNLRVGYTLDHSPYHYEFSVAAASKSAVNSLSSLLEDAETLILTDEIEEAEVANVSAALNLEAIGNGKNEGVLVQTSFNEPLQEETYFII